MKVTYLLTGSHLYGGVKVVLQHAFALRREGIEAWVVSPDPAPWWFPNAETVYRKQPLDPTTLDAADIVIGTVWTTVPIALALVARTGGVAAHFCQCYEGLYEPIRSEWADIDAVYATPTLKLAVSPHLVEILEERFDQPCHWIPQPLDHRQFFPPEEAPPEGKRPLRVLVTGHWQLDVKGTAAVLHALRPLVDEEPSLQLVRLVQDVTDDEIAFWPDAERHIGVPPHEVPEILRSVDLYVSGSLPVEGFGLPTLEAFACGRPAVVTDIGANRHLDPGETASIRVPVGDDAALRREVRRLRDEPALRRSLGREGPRIAAGFSEEGTGRILTSVLRAHRP